MELPSRQGRGADHPHPRCAPLSASSPQVCAPLCTDTKLLTADKRAKDVWEPHLEGRWACTCQTLKTYVETCQDGSPPRQSQRGKTFLEQKCTCVTIITFSRKFSLDTPKAILNHRPALPPPILTQLNEAFNI